MQGEQLPMFNEPRQPLPPEPAAEATERERWFHEAVQEMFTDWDLEVGDVE